MIKLSYLAQPPKRYTFEQPKLRKWVESYCLGTVVNLFAGKVRLDVEKEVRVDISDEFHPDFVMDAKAFCRTKLKIATRGRVVTVVFDPPYNIRKAREKYEGRWIGKATEIKNEIARILPRGSRVISLGYDTVGMAKCRGFSKIAIVVVCHGGDHNDTLALVEEKVVE